MGRMVTALVLAGLVFGDPGMAASEDGSPARGQPARAAPAASIDSSRVIFPPNHAVILAGTFNVIAKGMPGELTVDGQPQKWDPFAPPLSVARVGFTPGVHQIRIGSRKIDFSVALNEEEHDGPREWEIHRHHSIPAFVRCSVCHQTSIQAGLAIVGPPRTPRACFDCHPKADTLATHADLLKPLDRCQSCHSLHDSTYKDLLKAPPK
ncbi:MAG: hypothetical protein ACLQNE_07280 [Thermoguttaceae bacterium]